MTQIEINQKDQKLKVELENKIQRIKELIPKATKKYNRDLLKARLRSFEGILEDIENGNN